MGSGGNGLLCAMLSAEAPRLLGRCYGPGGTLSLANRAGVGEPQEVGVGAPARSGAHDRSLRNAGARADSSGEPLSKPSIGALDSVCQ
jgi:hypothetical protein